MKTNNNKILNLENTGQVVTELADLKKLNLKPSEGKPRINLICTTESPNTPGIVTTRYVWKRRGKGGAETAEFVDSPLKKQMDIQLPDALPHSTMPGYFPFHTSAEDWRALLD